MKKVQFKLKNKTRAFSLAMLATLVLFTGCNSYDDEITDLQGQIDAVVTDVATLKTSVAALQTSVSGMTYIKSITMGTDGKLTITPSVGNAIVYDAKNYVTYDIKLEGNNLIVNGANKGSVVIPPLTFDNGLLKSGTATVADLTAWLKSGLTVVDGFLAINGQKTTVAIPAAPGKTVKEVAIDGTNVKVTYTDNTSTVFANAPIVTSESATGTLVVNGVDTGVKIKNVYTVVDGFLAVNGVKTTVAIPTGNAIVLINKDAVTGEVLSATITDDKGQSITVKVNPTNELLSSILFVPTWIDGGVNAIEIGYINGITAPIGKVLFNETNVVYRFNPTTADVSKTTWKFVNNSARLTAAGQNAPGDATTLLAAPAYTSNGDGSGTFKLTVGTWAEPAAGQTHLVALQANGKDFYSGANTTVVSDYAKLVPVQYNPFISDAKKSSTVTNTYVHYRTVVPAITDANDFELVVGTPVDLKTLVLASANKAGVNERTFETYGFNNYKWEFVMPDYKGLDGVTNQNSFVTKSADNVLSVNAGSSVLDRNPLVEVKLLNAAGALIAKSYIKFKIVSTPTVPPVKPAAVTYTVTAPSAYAYASLFVDNVAGVSAGDYKDLALTWDQINANIYNPLGLTHNEFQAKFGGVTPTVAVKVNDVAVAGATLAQYPLIRSMLAPDVDTYAMKYQVTPLAKFGKTTITYTFDTGLITDAAVVLTFEFNVTKPTLDKTVLAGYRYNNLANEIVTQGMNAGSNYLMQLYLGEAFTFGTAAYRNVFGSAVAGKIDAATHTFQFKSTTPAQTGASLTPAVGGTIDQAYGTSSAPTSGQLMALTTKLTTASRVYDMQLVTNYPNAETDIFDFKVHFVNPFTIELASPVDFQLIDKVNGTLDTQDIKANYIVKFKGKNIVTKGVAETTNSATTVVASDFVDVNDAQYGVFYQLTPGNQYFTISKAGGNAYNKQSVITWDNSGTQLQSEQTVGTVNVKFVASFAEITKATADNITVKPE